MPDTTNPAPTVDLIPAATSPRPGWQTTEFWITAAWMAAMFIGAIADILPPKQAIIAATITGAIYKLVRLAVKLQAAGFVLPPAWVLNPPGPDSSGAIRTAHGVQNLGPAPRPLAATGGAGLGQSDNRTIGQSAGAASADRDIGLATKAVGGVVSPGIVACLLSCALFLSGCSTTGLDSAKNIRNAGLNAAGSAALIDAAQVLGQGVVSALYAAAQADMSGGSVTVRSLEQSAAHGLWSQVTPQSGGVNFGNIASAFSDGRARQTAIEAAKIAPGKNPAVTANAIAAVISTAAGAPPAI